MLVIAIQYRIGEHDERPWGNWTVLDVGINSTTKRIIVNPGARLSLQYHHHREETWIIVAGSGLASVGGENIPIDVGDTIFIKREQTHRVQNTSEKPLVFIEVQLGKILDENDIVRIQDDFGRPVSDKNLLNGPSESQ